MKREQPPPRPTAKELFADMMCKQREAADWQERGYPELAFIAYQQAEQIESHIVQMTGSRSSFQTGSRSLAGD